MKHVLFFGPELAETDALGLEFRSGMFMTTEADFEFIGIGSVLYGVS